MNRKELAPDASPVAAFGAFLRAKREARGWTQEELGVLSGYGGSHVSAVETARKAPTLRFSTGLDAAFGGDQFARRWREMRGGSVAEGLPEYLGCEARASEIRVFATDIVPGLLQTPAYTRALADAAVRRGALTSEQATEHCALVAERQAGLERVRPPMVHVVMDEGCIRRPVGGPEAMIPQCDRLIDFAGLPHTLLQIAPFAMAERRSVQTPVHVITMPDRSVLSYGETAVRGYLDRELSIVLPLLVAYHHLQAEALSQAESLALIQRARNGIA